MTRPASSGGLIVRSGRGTDAAALAELGARTFRLTFGGDNRPEDVESHVAATYTPELQAAELADPSSRYLVAEMSGEAHGGAGDVVGLALLVEAAAGDGVVAARPLRLLRLYVDPEVQGTGIGAALMAACIDDGRTGGNDVLWLGVWEHNASAITFYRRWGFTVVGEESFLLGRDLQRDILMALPL